MQMDRPHCSISSHPGSEAGLCPCGSWPPLGLYLMELPTGPWSLGLLSPPGVGAEMQIPDPGTRAARRPARQNPVSAPGQTEGGQGEGHSPAEARGPAQDHGEEASGALGSKHPACTYPASFLQPSPVHNPGAGGTAWAKAGPLRKTLLKQRGGSTPMSTSLRSSSQVTKSSPPEPPSPPAPSPSSTLHHGIGMSVPSIAVRGPRGPSGSACRPARL